MANTQSNSVEIWLFKGKNNFLKKTTGKVFGGIVNFKEVDPTKPAVWLGQQSYTINNMANKKSILFYDTLTHMLFKPRDMATSEDSVDMVMQTSQNVLLAGKEAKNALGIEEGKSIVFNLILGLAILIFIMFLVFMYLFYTHMPTPAGTVTTAATTTIGGIIPGGIVPKG